MNLEESLRQYILKHHLPGEDPAALALETPLIELGVLDSLAMTQLVVHIEKQYGIKVNASDLTEANFGTLVKLAAFIARAKKTAA